MSNRVRISPWGSVMKGMGENLFSEQHSRSQFPKSQFRLDTGNNTFPGMVGWRETGSPSLAVSEVPPLSPLPLLVG